MSELTHLDKSGNPQMVDVSAKNDTERTAKAQALINVGTELMQHLESNNFSSKKGSVIQTAILAGNMAVKKTADLIPLCHTLPIHGCSVDIEPISTDTFQITCTAKTIGKTGVEMEALTGASVAALTVYDMCKSFSKGIKIESVKLVEKTGGKNDFKSTS